MTTNDPTPDVDDVIDLEQLALEDVKLAAELAAIAERREQIKALLRDRLPIGTHQAGPYKVQVKAGPRRLDTTRIEADHPVTERPELYTARPDTAKVKHHIAAADLEAYYVAGAPTVVIG